MFAIPAVKGPQGPGKGLKRLANLASDLWMDARLRSASLIALLGVVVKLVGMARESATAAVFGRGAGLDAYLAALVVPAFVTNLIAGSLNAAVIPVYLHTKERAGIQSARRLASGTLFATIMLLLLPAVTLTIWARKVLDVTAPGLAPATRLLADKNLICLSLSIVICGMATLWGALLNAEKRYVVAAIAPGLVGLVPAVLLVVATRWLGNSVLTVGYTIGMSAQAVWLGCECYRLGLPVLPRWYGFSPELRATLSEYIPMVCGSLLIGGTAIVEQGMASLMGTGAISAINYANKFTMILTSIGALAIGTVALPEFSIAVAQADWPRVRKCFWRFQLVSFATAAGGAAILFVLSRWIVAVVYQRGHFTAEDTLLVSQLQQFYLIGAPCYVSGMVNVRLISALRGNRFLMFGAGISLGVNIALNLYLMHHIGIRSIPLTNSIMYILSFLFVFSISHWLLRRAERLQYAN